MKKIFILFIVLVSSTIFGQEYNKKTRYLMSTFHAQNTTINGISLGVFPPYSKSRFVKTNGIRLEIPGMGFLGFMGVGLRGTTVKDEIINGINISTGTLGDVQYNGFTIAGVSQSGVGLDGISISGFSSAMGKVNGVQISFFNTSQVINGIQIGIVNKSKKTKGIQLGLWNVNEKRQLPILNWNFKN